MAKQKGIVVIKGTVDGLNFYIRKGEPLVRKAGGGFNGAAIKKKDSMIRVRENGSEFGACAKAVKFFKKSLNPFLTQFSDGTLHYRFVQLFSQLKGFDEVSQRGERSVYRGLQTEAGRKKLAGYVITPGNSLQNVLKHTFRFNWGSEGFVIRDFDASVIKFPKGATRLELLVGCLVFDFDTYQFSLDVTAPFTIEKDYPVGTIQIVPDFIPNAIGFKIGVVFLRFTQETGGVSYPFKESEYTVLEIVYVSE